jgi:hypothetical protein
MPILLWHLPWVVLFGAWDVAASAHDTRNVESHVDAQAALDETRLARKSENRLMTNSMLELVI